MLTATWTPHIKRKVWLRSETSDDVAWGDTFTGLYHVPPASMPTPATVLDLGSNIGLTLADYCYRWPAAQIVGVEMDADNLALASSNAPDAKLVHAAVAASSGLRYYDSNAAPFAYRLGDDEDGIAVQTRTLGELIVSQFGGRADFVKMDVEGTEWELFEAGEFWAAGVRHLLVELHADPRDLVAITPAELVSRAIPALEALGFEARHHERHPAAVWATR